MGRRGPLWLPELSPKPVEGTTGPGVGAVRPEPVEGGSSYGCPPPYAFTALPNAAFTASMISDMARTATSTEGGML